MSGPPSMPTAGTRSRAGNAMGRTREALMTGAARAVERYGSRRATMGDIASLAGIAKGTLYNHFRTKDDVYRALVCAQVEAVAAECVPQAGSDLAAALARAATVVGSLPAVRKVAAGEPAVIAALATPGDGPAWQLARTAIGQALEAAGRTPSGAAVETVLRQLVSYLLVPGDAGQVAVAATTLAAGLPAAN